MTFRIYALFPEGSYLVGTSNDSEHGLDVAARAMGIMGMSPHAYAALPPDGSLRGKVLDFNDLKNRLKT